MPIFAVLEKKKEGKTIGFFLKEIKANIFFLKVIRCENRYEMYNFILIL
jgi:hypothetical protein